MSRPVLYVVAGPNGAGKSSRIRFIVPQGVPVLDGDQILKDLDKFELADPYTAAQNILNEQVDSFLSTQQSFGFETNFHLSGYVTSPESIIQRALALGYELDLLFVGLDSPLIAFDRVATRVELGGHDVDGFTVLERYEGGLATLKAHFSQFDQAYVFDNSGRDALPVLYAEKGRIIKLSDVIPQWVLTTLAESIELYRNQRD